MSSSVHAHFRGIALGGAVFLTVSSAVLAVSGIDGCFRLPISLFLLMILFDSNNTTYNDIYYTILYFIILIIVFSVDQVVGNRIAKLCIIYCSIYYAIYLIFNSSFERQINNNDDCASINTTTQTEETPLAPLAPLTPREREVLSLMLHGYTPELISEELCLSKWTVDTHIRHIYQKYDVHTKNELIKCIYSNTA
ncbi:helix-turn-helix transcriptional regulator [bacterium]|nr:helix-turn-helix transcriptional regulator [bacterium]